ncbi:MAG TPA: thioredoxin-dependent thiol peroxidase [Chitinophagaceae bacterium]|jgi:peroxiredoxin Q/BCP|nr:thioredoxin-dependent thiol peroxidase [Chitinophagaceae bacterium]
MATLLEEGQKAPMFSGIDEKGEKVSLKEFKGQKVVLYFYPQDDTPTCTVQACNLRDHYAELKKEGYKIIGISPDDTKSHQKFKTKYNLPFTLIADVDHKIIDTYGVWGEKSLYGRTYMGLHRTTFIINARGIIEKIIRKPRSKMHSEEIMK